MKPGSNPILFIATVVLALSGCASVPQHLGVGSVKNIRNVAVVSLLPDEVNLSEIRIVSSEHATFGLGSQVADTVDAVVRDRIVQAHPDWTIKNIVYDRNALLAHVQSASVRDLAQVKEALAGLAHNNGLDAIFVVRAAADQPDVMHPELIQNNLLEGLNVLLKENTLSGDARLLLRANLGVSVVGPDGNVLAASAAPAELDKGKSLDPDDYDVRSEMKHNLRPEVTQKLGVAVLADLTQRLNFCFDALGFAGKPAPAPVVAQPVAPSTGNAPAAPAAQAAPDAFDLCFARCRKYTDRTKDQCFDACNK